MTYKLDSISDEEAKRQSENATVDIWIDAPVSNEGLDPKFFGMAMASSPFGFNGPATVKFNLTAYIKHMIEQSKGQL